MVIKYRKFTIRADCCSRWCSLRCGVGGITLGVMASYLQFTKSFTQPFMQVAQQFNSIVMALAGAERIFALIDEKPETDEGYVTLVNAKRDADGNIIECKERTGMWAWKHPHSADGSVSYTSDRRCPF